MKMRRTARTVALLALLVTLQGCFTLRVWGVEYNDLEDGTSVQFTDDDIPWTWRTVGARVLLTPFAMALDLITLPIQGGVLCFRDGDDDRDEHHEHRGRREHHRH